MDPHKKVHDITREERARILRALKGFEIPLSGFRPIEEAIVTSGGIAVKEINPKSMQSKCIKNLYFAGEMIDVDAYTGGYNLQIAFSTGYLAGQAAAQALLSL
jgi:predicted flavoprotein YhiN